VAREQLELLRRAIEREGEAHRLLLEGRTDDAGEALREVAELYRGSWEGAPSDRYGRLIGMLKAAILTGTGEDAATFAKRELEGDRAESATKAYALALAALAHGDDAAATDAAEAMRTASDAFDRTAEAVAALATRDRDRYADALRTIVADFEARERHLTGVAIADTALVLEALAAERGMAAKPSSPVLPAA
jgi:hypothetical protein